MKLFFLISLLLFSFGTPTLSEVRKAYVAASQSEEGTNQLNEKLVSITESDAPELLAYKGAVMTLMAKYTRKKGEKLSYFKDGVAHIETAMAAAPNNIEIRTIRLSIQEHAPKFLRYHKNKEEDKQFIMSEFTSIKSNEIRTFVAAFVSQSSEFSEAEKALF